MAKSSKHAKGKYTDWGGRGHHRGSQSGTRCSGVISQIAVEVLLGVSEAPNECACYCRVSHTSKNLMKIVNCRKTDMTTTLWNFTVWFN